MNNENQNLPANPFGITREELLEMAAQKLADMYAENDDLAASVSAKIEDRIKQLFAETITVRIETFLHAEMERLISMEIRPVDIWGKPTGAPTTIRAQLAARAKEFWDTKVDTDGRPSTYSKTPRHEQLLRKIVGDEFREAMRQNVVNIAAQFKDAVRDDLKAKVDGYLNEFFRVKSRGDK